MTGGFSNKSGSQQSLSGKVFFRGISRSGIRQPTLLRFLAFFLFVIAVIIHCTGEATAVDITCGASGAGITITNKNISDLPLPNTLIECATSVPGVVNVKATHNFRMTSGTPVLNDGTNEHPGTVTGDSVEWNNIAVGLSSKFTISQLRGDVSSYAPYSAVIQLITITPASGTATVNNPQVAKAVYCPKCSECSSVIPLNPINGDFKIYNQNTYVFQPNLSLSFSGTFDASRLAAGKFTFGIDLNSITTGTPQQQCNPSAITQTGNGYQFLGPDVIVNGNSFTIHSLFDPTLPGVPFTLTPNGVWPDGGQPLDNVSALAYAADSLRGEVIGKNLSGLSGFGSLISSASSTPINVPCANGGSFDYEAAGANAANFKFNDCISRTGDSLSGGLNMEDHTTFFVMNTDNLWNITSYQGVSLDIWYMNTRLIASSTATSPTTTTFISDINGSATLTINNSTAWYIYDRGHSETEVSQGSTILNFMKVSGNLCGGKAQGCVSPALITPYSETPDPVPLSGMYGLNQINFLGSQIKVNWNNGAADVSVNGNTVGHFDNPALAVQYGF